MNHKPAAIAAAAVALAAVSLPVTAQAGGYGKEQFGAKLTTSVQPSNSLPSHQCDAMDPAAMCTFVMNGAYGRPGAEKAKKAGRLKKIKVISGGAGTFRLQLVKARFRSIDNVFTAVSKRQSR